MARPYCGRLGKIDNGPIGIDVADSTPRAFTLLDADLDLSQEGIEDPSRRDKTYLPKDVPFRTNGERADDLVQRLSPPVPHAWIVGDDE